MKLSEYIVSKKEILLRISEEQIFERYLGEPVNLTGLFKNSNRDDKTAGCSFFIRDSDNRLIFHDHSRMQYDCFDFVMEKYRCSFYEALKIISYDFGLTKDEVKKVEYVNKTVKKVEGIRLKIKRKLFSKQELAYWSIGGLQIQPNDLITSKIYSIEAFWELLNGSVVLTKGLTHVYAYHWNNYNYQLYFPLKQKGYRRFINPPGIKWGDEELLPQIGNHLVITKSKKDSFYLRMFGINSIFVINEKIVLPEELMIDLKIRFNTIATLFDNDRTGKHLTYLYKKKYETIALIVPEGKDFSGYLNIVGKDYIVDVIKHFKTEFL